MKANFPVEYMAAVLTADSGDTEKVSEVIHECERMGIEVLPPDINESFSEFSVVPGKQQIRFGLTTIKNFGEGIALAIITERSQNGHFASLNDFLMRIHDKNLNKKSLEALIKTGAFDSLGEERGQLLDNLETILAFNKEQVAGQEANQDSLFGSIETTINELVLAPAPAATKEQKLLWERELLGVYVSGHPLDQFRDEIAKRTKIGEIKHAVLEQHEISIVKMKGEVVVAGMIETVRELLTKKGDRMAFVQLANHTDVIEMVTFPEVFQNNKDLLIPGTCVAVKGKLSIRNDEPSILVDKIKALASKQPTIETVDTETTMA
jgi:DNA polymerase-3 subunit alpha